MFNAKQRFAYRMTILFVAITALALTGCGSGGSSSGSSTPSEGSSETIATSSLSKPEFIKQADEICTRESKHLLELIAGYMSEHESHPGRSEKEVTAEGTRKVLAPKFQAQIDEIRRLGAPAGDEQQVEAFLAAMQHAVFSLEKRNEINLATDIDREFQHAGELALDYGLESCAN